MVNLHLRFWFVERMTHVGARTKLGLIFAVKVDFPISSVDKSHY